MPSVRKINDHSDTRKTVTIRKDSMAQEEVMEEGPGTDHSLIPIIKAEEDRLAGMLKQTDEDAEKLVQDAERQAAERVENTKRDLPVLMAERRSKAVEEIESRANADRQKSDTEEQRLKKNAEGNVNTAVNYILSLVRPECKS